MDVNLTKSASSFLKVYITSPYDGSTVSDTVNIAVSARSSNVITKVEFYIDESLKFTDTSSPYSYSWNTTEYTNGSYTIKVIAYDTGDQTASDQHTVIVSNAIKEDIDVYFPIAKGAKWEYRVDFPQNCNVPYSPWFEYPEAMLGTSITHGMGSWNAGQIDFEMLINDIYETSSNSSTWDISLSELGLKFYFYRTDTDTTQCRLRLTIENGNANLDIIAVLPIGDPNWVIARSLARVNSEDLNQTFDVSVPSGEYKNCVKSVVNIYGDGTYVPSGTYPIEIYLAPNIGVVKAVGKDRNGTILYTLELSNFNN
jgi:hypothetical protein